MYLLLTLFSDHCKRVGKYCAIVGMNKFAFDCPTTKKTPTTEEVMSMFENKDLFLPTQAIPSFFVC